jgi:hypothetical protein
MSRCFWSAAVAALVWATAAHANIGPRWWGDVTTEPWGLKDVAITSEKLTIDLRPLAAGQLVRVDVIYHLNNAGGSKTLDLLFVSGEEGVSEFEASLGDRRLECRPLSRDELRRHWDRFPKSWEPPTKLPGIEWPETYSRVKVDWRTHAVPMAFSLELPPGPSTLHVRYGARASGTDESHPTVTWQFPYVLAPAREWGSFGELDVTALVPENWESRSTPDLKRDGETLTGHFTGLPADALVLSARAPVPSGLKLVVWIYVVLYGLAVVGGGFLCWWCATWLGKFLAGRFRLTPTGRGGVAVQIVTVAITLPLLWPALIYCASRLALAGSVGYLGGQESPYFHEPFIYLDCSTGFFMTGAAVLGLVIAAQTGARLVSQVKSGN